MFLEYMPIFIGKDDILAHKCLGSFQNLMDKLEIMHEDVLVRLFSKYFVGDVSFLFKNMEVCSIGSWVELYSSISRYWGEKKSFDQYLTNICSLRAKKDGVVATFNNRFYRFICSMPLEIQPFETLSMMCYL
jgi:hypothetical protein